MQELASREALALSALKGEARTHLGELVGGAIFCIFGPAYGSADAELKSTAMRDLCRTAFAIAAYRIERKRYPEKLEELVPEYIQQVPADAFSNEPLRYSLTNDGYLLSSVGKGSREDDIVVRP